MSSFFYHWTVQKMVIWWICIIVEPITHYVMGNIYEKYWEILNSIAIHDDQMREVWNEWTCNASRVMESVLKVSESDFRNVISIANSISDSPQMLLTPLLTDFKQKNFICSQFRILLHPTVASSWVWLHNPECFCKLYFLTKITNT